MPSSAAQNRRDPSAARAVRLATVLAAMALLAGCLDAEALQEARQHEQQDAPLAEIDLGAFQAALPKRPGEPPAGQIDFHVFGEVKPDDRAAVEAALASRGPELRAQMLASVRSLTPEELRDPLLRSLRSRIVEVVNRSLDKPLVEAVGFYRIAYHEH